MKGRPNDLTGQVFGRLTVTRRASSIKYKSSTAPTWLCHCTCGGQIVTRGDRLKYGTTSSCGCLYSNSPLRLKHGESKGRSKTREYVTWQAIVQRCGNPNNHAYSYYGGRGISICDRWKSSYENFLDDMGRMPGEGYSIERVDVNGDYSPDNCKWATMKEQSRNKRVGSRNRSGVTGVSPYKNNRWVARITNDRKLIHIGIFDTLEAASKARKEAENKYWFNKSS